MEPQHTDPPTARSGPVPGSDLRSARLGVLGCFLAVIAAPLLGLAVHKLTDAKGVALTAASLVFLLALIVTLVNFARMGGGRPGPMTWSFTPLGASIIAATDILAVSGDASAGFTAGLGYLVLVIPCSLLGGTVVFLTEWMESRRLGYSLLKAAVGALLIFIPLPVGGLLGGGVSLGHRMLGGLKLPQGGDELGSAAATGSTAESKTGNSRVIEGRRIPPD